jgi:hypothetical protein
MIIIKEPNIQLKGGQVILSYPFTMNNEQQILWYKIPDQFQKYVVTERLDAALVALLFLGLKTGQDIYLKGVVSARLFYTITHYLINAIALSSSDYIKIKIEADELDDRDLNIGKQTGTGLSCGVDSFATYYDHKNAPEDYQISYFTFFNVGSHGDFGGERARNFYSKRLKGIKKFAEKVNKDVIEIDSNLSEILRLNFQRTHTLRSISCVLILQKLFKTFYYASSIRFENFELDEIRIAEFDLLNLQMLSTESTQFFSSAAQLTRVERIELISNKSETFEHLDVCVNSTYIESNINCSRCHKCIRTMLTLEVLGVLDNYKRVFDLNDFKTNRSKYIGELIFKINKETLDYEVLSLIETENFQIPKKSYFYGILSNYNYQKNRFKKMIKKKLKCA